MRDLLGRSDWWAGMKPEARKHIWLGVSVEDKPTADERIPELLQTPAAVRFVSYEPALSAVDFEQFPLRNLDGGENPGIDWIIVGGESGPGARTFDVAWAASTIKQCRDAGVPVFVKQLGSRPVMEDRAKSTPVDLKDRKGGDWAEWPEHLRVREFRRSAPSAGSELVKEKPNERRTANQIR
jgi:protein gp37